MRYNGKSMYDLTQEVQQLRDEHARIERHMGLGLGAIVGGMLIVPTIFVAGYLSLATFHYLKHGEWVLGLWQ